MPAASFTQVSPTKVTFVVGDGESGDLVLKTADNDITGYDVYIGTSPTLATPVKADIKNMFLNGVAVTSGVTYYWKVATKDAHGNTSDTGVYQFSIK